MPYPGPCVICGGRDYELSCGGPSICPSCDAGNFTAGTVQRQTRELERRRAEIERLTAENERLRDLNKRFATVIVEGNNSEMEGNLWDATLSEADSINQQETVNSRDLKNG